MTPDWKPCPRDLFFSKNDKADPRLGDYHSENSDKPALVIGGFPDDEGIRLSKGRPGAAQAPDIIRKHFYKMTPPVFASGRGRIVDAGNLELGGDLASRHEKARFAVRDVLRQGGFWAGLGGGHDYGYADGAGFLDALGDKRPLIVNFDAHLDVRPILGGLSSGTPFYRLLETFKGFDLLEIGIQSQCNSRSHLAWLAERGGKVIGYDEVIASGRRLVDVVIERAGDWLLKARPVYLSVDLDGFSTSQAPGVSQGFATGFEPREFFELFDLLCARLDARVLGLYEVSPPLDIDERTSKLAALILHRYLSANWAQIST